MSPARSFRHLISFTALGVSSGILGTLLINEVFHPQKLLANPSFFEYRWDNTANYKKLYYWQSSKDKRDRATYYLVMRPTDRKTAILKLTISIPDHFDADIKPGKLSLCQISLGGMLSKTKCIILFLYF